MQTCHHTLDMSWYLCHRTSLAAAVGLHSLAQSSLSVSHGSDALVCSAVAPALFSELLAHIAAACYEVETNHCSPLSSLEILA